MNYPIILARNLTKNPKNSLLWYATHLQSPVEQPTPQTVDSFLGYATHFQRRTVPKAALAAPDASSVRETAPLGGD